MGTWVLGKTVWVTILVSLPILGWWIYFLLIWPSLMKQIGSWDDH